MKQRIVIHLTLVLALVTTAAEALECKPAGNGTRLIPSGAVYSYDLSTVINVASEIRIDESLWPDFHTLVRSTTWRKGKPEPTFVHATVEPRALYYRVSAFNPDNPSFGGCTWTDQVAIMPDAETQRRFRRTIVPAAGSTAGAFGSRFRTSLVLLNPFDAPLGGRIVFHPVQTPGSDADPSIHYRIAGGQHIEYADVMSSIGVSGLGSLDIVPDDDSFAFVPVAHVTIYNDAGNGATYGMAVPQIRAGDIEANYLPLDLVVPNRAQKRLNVGIRTGGNGGWIQATVTRTDGSTLRVEKTFPADYFIQSSIDDLFGATLATGESVRIYATNAVAYATETNNVTNDPVMLIPFANAADTDVGYFW